MNTPRAKTRAALPWTWLDGGVVNRKGLQIPTTVGSNPTRASKVNFDPNRINRQDDDGRPKA